MTDGTHIALEDLALFAMHSASQQEAAVIQAHLEQCPHCRAEFEKLSTELAMVAMSVDQQSLPSGARERFMDRITAAPNANSQSSIVATRQKTGRNALTAWVPWALAAALALLAITMGIRINSLNRELRNQTRQIAEFATTESRAQKVLDVLTAPASQHILLTSSKTAPLPTARAVYLPSRGGLIFQASNMRQLTQNWTYELWVIPADGSAPIAAGLFRPDAAGSASVVLPPLPVGVAAKALGVTMERAGGSTTPTAPILLSGSVSAS